MRRDKSSRRRPRLPYRSRLRRRDLASEALAGMLQRPLRAALTALGTVLGVGSFVAVLGLTATASSQIDARFTKLAATEVTLEDVAAQRDELADPGFPPDAERRIRAVNGVRAAGVYWPVRLPESTEVRSAPIVDGSGSSSRVEVIAAGPGMLRAAVPELAQGRLYDSYAQQTLQPVAVLGASVARELGISTLDTHPAVFIGEQPFTVVGILSDVRREPSLLTSIAVPETVAQRYWGPPGPGEARMLVATRLGAARQVAEEAPTALRPDHPDYLKAIPPAEPKALRAGVGDDLNRLFLVLAAICLVIGAVGIANTTLVAVLERTGEIGLRRALGARAHHVTLQFLTESGLLGAFGGLLGTGLGAAVVVTVAVLRSWTPVVHPAVLGAAPALGLATGLLAGAYPAWRASRIQPAEALRR